MHMQIGVYRVNSESRFRSYPTSIFTSQQTLTSFSPASTVLLDKCMWTLVEDWSSVHMLTRHTVLILIKFMQIK